MVFESLFAQVGEIAVIRAAVVLLVFAIMLLVTQLIPAFKGNQKLSVFLSVIVALLAVLGFSDSAVVTIMSGYSAIGFSILLLLPTLVLARILFWKADTVQASLVKLVSAILLLFFVQLVLSAFESLVGGMSGLDRFGTDVEGILSMITFALYVVIFFFGFDFISKLFAGNALRS